MEDSPLNKAHQLYRRAEALVRQKKFDDAIEANQNALVYLQESLSLTKNPHALESINLQITYHKRQVESIKIKKLKHEADEQYRKNLKYKANFLDCELVKDDSLQSRIFRTMENHDSLVLKILNNIAGDNGESSNSDTEDKDTPVNLTSGVGIGKKHQVDNSTIIEEYRVLCENLRDLVQVLVMEVEIRDKRIVELGAKIEELESETEKAESKNNNGLKVITDSSGGTSPYVFSPCSELSPEVHDTTRGPSRLVPLEMPTFDFNQLSVMDSASSNNNNSSE